MKSFLAFALFLTAVSPAFADVVLPPTKGVECATVDADDQGQPDLKQYNQDLNRKQGNPSTELASVSVTPLNGKFLVCSTTKAATKK